MFKNFNYRFKSCISLNFETKWVTLAQIVNLFTIKKYLHRVLL